LFVFVSVEKNRDSVAEQKRAGTIKLLILCRKKSG